MEMIFEKELPGLLPIKIESWKYGRNWKPDRGFEYRKLQKNSFFVGDERIPVDSEWMIYDANYVLEKPLVISVIYIVPGKECESEHRYVCVKVTYSSEKGNISYKTTVEMTWVRPFPIPDYVDEIRIVREELKKPVPYRNGIISYINARFGKESYLVYYFTELTSEMIEKFYKPFLFGSFTKYIDI